MKVKIKRLHKDAIIPKYAKEGDAGLDFTAITHEMVENDIDEYGTGLAIEIPEGYVGLLFPRSSIYKYTLDLTNSVGIIDSGYRGEIRFKFRNYSDWNNIYGIGDRIGQMLILPYPQIELEESEELLSSERGALGFGSSGN